MFEEGMSQNLERCMDRAAGSHTDLMVLCRMVRKASGQGICQVQCRPVNFSQDITIEGRKYATRFGTVTFCTEERKTLRNVRKRLPEDCCHPALSDDLKTLLKEAVLTGYDLQKDDFDED